MLPGTPKTDKLIHLYVRVACKWEARARKAGNVHPGKSFAGLSVYHFYRSAMAIAPVFADASRQSVGKTVWRAIVETRRVVRSNTNLGIVLLLAPLAAVPPEQPLHEGIDNVLASLSVEDARLVFMAIRHVQPGGLREVPEQDVRRAPTMPLRSLMALAQDRDLIARQYVNGFHEVFDEGLPALAAGIARHRELENAIVCCHLDLMARHPDSLIARKRGLAEASEASRQAREVLDAGWPDTPKGRTAFADLDVWLRAEGNARNPGTSADLVTACLFAALREGIIDLAQPLPWSRGS